jgi:acyl dehydratase
MKKFKLNQKFKHWPGKTITESDNNLFCLVTQNSHPLHIDKNFAKKTQFKKRVVVGTYVFSLVVGLTVKDISMNAIANLNYSNVNHLAPTFIGDTLYAKSEIIEIKKSRKDSKKKIIKIKTVAFNQNNKNILEFQREILIKN